MLIRMFQLRGTYLFEKDCIGDVSLKGAYSNRMNLCLALRSTLLLAGSTSHSLGALLLMNVVCNQPMILTRMFDAVSSRNANMTKYITQRVPIPPV